MQYYRVIVDRMKPSNPNLGTQELIHRISNVNPVGFSLDVDRSYMELSCKGISSILVKDSTKNSSDMVKDF